MRCFRVLDLERVRYKGSKQGHRPALFGEKERVWKESTQNNMDAEKFDHPIRRLSTKFKNCGKKVVVHFHNASCRSRRRDRWVSRVEVEEGEVAKRGCEE